MALKLDDFLAKKKEPAQILDLSKVSVNSQEELKKTMEKVPEYKIKMDKITPEEVKILEKKSSTSTKLRNADAEKNAYRIAFSFANPIPCDMRSLRLEDLCSVNIQWRMLTSLRPKTKTDEEYFSKLVELGKLHLHARHKERNKCFAWYERKSKNKAGITEIKITRCRDCGEEFCLNETCRMFGYDSYERYVTLDEKQQQQQQQQQSQRQPDKPEQHRRRGRGRKNDIGGGATTRRNCKKIKRRTPRIKKHSNGRSNKAAREPTAKSTSHCRSNTVNADTYAIPSAKHSSATAAATDSNKKKANHRSGAASRKKQTQTTVGRNLKALVI